MKLEKIIIEHIKNIVLKNSSSLFFDEDKIREKFNGLNIKEMSDAKIIKVFDKRR